MLRGAVHALLTGTVDSLPLSIASLNETSRSFKRTVHHVQTRAIPGKSSQLQFVPAVRCSPGTVLQRPVRVLSQSHSSRYRPVLSDSLPSLALQVWDVRCQQSLLTKKTNSMLLSCDWNKYDDNLIVTGAADNHVAVWDLRQLAHPSVLLPGHQSAVRRVRCSPHHKAVIASASYDFSLMVWDTDVRQAPLRQQFVQHTEFVVGCDWHLQQPDLLASTAWYACSETCARGRHKGLTKVGQNVMPV